MLQNYDQKPSQNWRSKDAAIYLVTSSASKGQTQKHGVTQSSDLVPLPQFAIQQIEPELAKDNGNKQYKYRNNLNGLYCVLFFQLMKFQY